MSDETTNITHSTVPRYSRYAKIGIFFTTLGLVVLITAYGYGYFQLSQINITLANMIEQLQKENVTQSQNIQDLNATIEKIQTNDTASGNRLDAHEKMLSELNAAKKGDMNRWQIAEAEYLVKLAYERIMFSENNSTALPLLERAQDMIQSINDPRASTIQEALNKNISDLKNQSAIDTSKVYNQIIALDQQIDKLELPFAPLSTQNKIEEANGDPDMSWWQKGLRHTANILKQVVIVKRNDSNSLPVVMPDEKAYLYQNLHAQTETLIWSLLHQQQDMYQTSLTRMQTWITNYFVQSAETTQSTLKAIHDLQSVNLTIQKIDLSPTLNLFEQYLMGAAPDTKAS